MNEFRLIKEEELISSSIINGVGMVPNITDYVRIMSNISVAKSSLYNNQRIVISLKDVDKKLVNNVYVNNDGVKIVEYGCFPQYITAENCEDYRPLKIKCRNVYSYKLDNIMKFKSTIYSGKKNDYMKEAFIINTDSDFSYLLKYNLNTYGYFLGVDPIKWYVDYDNNILIAKDILLLNHDNEFLKKYFSKEIFQNRKIDLTKLFSIQYKNECIELIKSSLNDLTNDIDIHNDENYLYEINEKIELLESIIDKNNNNLIFSGNMEVSNLLYEIFIYIMLLAKQRNTNLYRKRK